MHKLKDKDNQVSLKISKNVLITKILAEICIKKFSDYKTFAEICIKSIQTSLMYVSKYISKSTKNA